MLFGPGCHTQVALHCESVGFLSTSSSSSMVCTCHAPSQLYLALTAVHLFSCGGCLWPADMHEVADYCSVPASALVLMQSKPRENDTPRPD